MLLQQIQLPFRLCVLVFLFIIQSISFGADALPQNFYLDLQRLLAQQKNSHYHIKECPCLPGFIRPKKDMSKSLRGKLDLQVRKYMAPFLESGVSPTMIFFGSGRLLNELTVITSMMSMGVSPTIVLVDIEYPVKYAKSLEIFHNVIAKLCEKYNVTAKIEVYPQMKFAMESLLKRGKHVDFYFMIDFYFDPVRCFDRFKEFLADYALYNKALFFILAKTKSLGPKYQKRDWGSSLSIYEAEFDNGNMIDIQNIFHVEHK